MSANEVYEYYEACRVLDDLRLKGTAEEVLAAHMNMQDKLQLARQALGHEREAAKAQCDDVFGTLGRILKPVTR